MPGISSDNKVSPSQAIDRYFEVALYLMVLSGFATLAQTGQLDPPSVLLVIAALVARGYLLAGQKAFILKETWTQYLTIGFLVLSPVDFFLVSGKFVTATVHLVLALMVVRLFSARRDRDYVFLSILSFLQVLAASVLTIDSTFLVAFAAFLLTAVATFILLEMRRSSRGATLQARAVMGADTQRMGLHLAGASPVLVFYILLVAAAIFFVLPRISGGYLGAYAPGGQLSIGFSDRVELGQIGEIQQSNSVVMHVQIEGDQRGAYDLKWRGVALASFDGKSWFSPAKQIIVPRLSDGRFDLEAPELPSARKRGPRIAKSHPIHYRVLLEPLGTNVFFLAPRAQAVEGAYQIVTTDQEGAIYNLDRERQLGLYEADSDVSQPSAAELRSAAGESNLEFLQKYLQLPALDARIPALAQQVTTGGATSYDKAAAIELYLKNNYVYTLNLGRTVPKDPLAAFLFERKQGHCEYFASSMAVMLRTLKIPARIVNGFRTGEFNDVNSQYLIRARNAHSWVEAYFPGYGWISFDPTPPALQPARTGWSRTLLYLDAAAAFWREWIINYDFGHQRSLGQEAAHTTRGFFQRARDKSRDRYTALLEVARHLRHRLARSPRTWTVAGVLAVVLLFLGVKARQIQAFIRSLRVAAHPEKAPPTAASIWYQRMTRAVGRRGWTKSPAQTPAEFVSSIQDAVLKESVRRFTEGYRNARFGNSTDDAKRLPQLYAEISGLGRG